MSIPARPLAAPLLACLLAIAVERADAQPGKAAADNPQGLKMRLFAQQDRYVLDTGGKSAEDFRKQIDAIVPDKGKPPTGPKVNLVLEISNPSAQEAMIWVGGDDTRLTLELHGPGAVTKVVTREATADIKTSKAIAIPAGKTYSRPITDLGYPYPRRTSQWYWTKPGEYTLSATWKLGAANKGQGKGPTLIAAPIQLHVTAPKPGDKSEKDASLEKHGVKPAEPRKDPKTGFVVGGKNDTALIRKLTEINGISIAALEKIMRPGASSSAGFLGKDEKLLDVLAADNDLVLKELGSTHQELARHLHALGALGETSDGKAAQFTYQGHKFKVKVIAYRGHMASPFKDGTKTNKNAFVENLDNGKKLEMSLLVPDMIERYGFYEGKGTSYRVDPRQAVAVLGFLSAKARDGAMDK
jgi:hypothetical protein